MNRRPRILIRVDQIDSTIAARAAEKLLHAQVDASARGATSAETMADWDVFETINRALPATEQRD